MAEAAAVPVRLDGESERRLQLLLQKIRRGARELTGRGGEIRIVIAVAPTGVVTRASRIDVPEHLS